MKKSCIFFRSLVGIAFLLVGGYAYSMWSPAFGLAKQISSKFPLYLDKDSALFPLLKNLINSYELKTDFSSSNIVEVTQKNWLRKPDSERWHIVDNEQVVVKRNVMMPLLQQLGYVDTILPALKEYDYMVILGATVQRMRRRFGFGNQLVSSFPRTTIKKGIIVTVGQRPLFNQENDKREPFEVLVESNEPLLPLRSDWKYESFMKLPTTETEAAQWIYAQSDLSKEFKALPIHYIDTPMTIKPDGSAVRPTTESTLREMLKSFNKPGTYLVISDNPYIPYQRVVVRSLLPESMYVEAAGPASDADVKLMDYLDSVARTLYVEHNWMKS